MDNKPTEPISTNQTVTPTVPVEPIETAAIESVVEPTVEPVAPTETTPTVEVAAEPVTLEIEHADAQPTVQPVVEPATESAPQPVDAVQPVAVQPPVAAEQPVVQVQYVINERSLEGIGGWLVFYLATIALNSLLFLAVFFGAITEIAYGSSLPLVVSTVLAPVITVTGIASIVFITLRKKLGKTLAVASIAATGLLYASSPITNAIQDKTNITPIAISAILTMIISSGLYSLYFFVSKRVAKTLVK